jgi:hypothetical protein
VNLKEKNNPLNPKNPRMPHVFLSYGTLLEKNSLEDSTITTSESGKLLLMEND